MMPESDTLILVNPSRRAIRLFVILACVCLLPAAVCGLLLALGGRFDPASHSDASVACLTTVFTCGAIAFAMLLSAAISVPAARSVERNFDQFRRGELLADWIFPPEEWNTYLARERERAGKARLGAIGLVLGPLALVAALIAVGLGASLPERIGLCAAAWTAIAALAALAFALSRAASRRKFSRVARSPRVLIGKTGVYCAENFALWGSYLLTLRDVRVIPGDPARLSFTVGPGSGVRAVGAVLGAASQVAGAGSAGMAMSNATRRTVVPIPSARLGEAEQLVAALAGPPRPAPSWDPPPIPADHPRAAVDNRPAASRSAAGTRFSARALWITAACEIAIGLALILLANPSSSDQAAVVGGYALLGDFAGLFLWVASVPTAIVAIVRSVRHSY